MKVLTLATRKSPLALWQAEQVERRLRVILPQARIEILKVHSKGDRIPGAAIATLSTTGVFTREVDREVSEGRAQMAVHSLKDQPTTLSEGLLLGMVLPRGPVEDVLVSRTASRLADLAPGARVATGSLRRRAQLLRARPDLVPVDIRGNVETRLRKLDDGEAEALLLARAGLERLGLEERISEVISPAFMMPAVAQGIVGVICRTDDGATREILASADHAPTHTVALAERAFLRRLGGGCNVPAGALGELSAGVLSLRARILSADGRQVLEDAREGPPDEAEAIGTALAAILEAGGAGDMLRELRP